MDFDIPAKSIRHSHQQVNRGQDHKFWSSASKNQLASPILVSLGSSAWVSQHRMHNAIKSAIS